MCANERPWVGLKPTTFYTIDTALYHMYMHVHVITKIPLGSSLSCLSQYVIYNHYNMHVLTRDEEGGRKQARSNKQQGKATQHIHVLYMYRLNQELMSRPKGRRSVQLRGTAFESERSRHFPYMDLFSSGA